MPNRGEGPIPARVMLVGEAWGADEEREGLPLVGAAGLELNRMLHEAGILRSECFATNLVNRRPANNDMAAWIAIKKKDITPQHKLLFNKYCLQPVHDGLAQLLAEIKLVNPNLIIAFGNYAMWALSAGKCWGIRNWRGSLLQAEIAAEPTAPKLIPTIHPAAVLREWSFRAPLVNDLRRAKRQMDSRNYDFPTYNFIVQPSLAQTMEQLDGLLSRLNSGEELWIEGDLETGIKHRHIKCIGVSQSRTQAICIPFMALSNPEGYWSAEEEGAILFRLYKLLTHRNARVRWQNGLFDLQYIFRRWHFVPRCDQDTMISQHAMFSDLPKSLAYQASIYCEHYIFWKEEGKTEVDVPRTQADELAGWIYNCKDVIYTRECGEVELATVRAMKLEKVHEFQQAMLWPVLKAMIRGVKVDMTNRNRLAGEIQEQLAHRQQFLNDVIGYELNVRSAPQMIDLFYQQLGQPAIMSRAKKGIPAHVTCDDEALSKIATREPLLKPIVSAIQDIRTLEIFLGNFVLAALDTDGRMRCSYNIGGSESGKSAPKTYRLSSSKNAFGTGTNLQNIPSEKSKSVGKATARGHIALLGDPYQLPNVRSLFGPDSGKIFFDMDLDRADLQVMAWDSGDELLKAALRKKVDVHLLNVYVLDAKEPPPLEELVEGHPKYPDHRGPRKHKREFAKVFCHATDYLGKSRTVAAATGRTVHEVDRAQKIYLGTYKGIKAWQDRVIDEVRKRRYVENKFGYRWYIFDRLDDSVMPEAVAWIPQSTVSIVINRIWMNLFQGVPENHWDLSVEHMMKLLHTQDGIEVLLQVHDSLAGQFPTNQKEASLKKMQELSAITIPYDDPLVIPTGISTSELTWGDC